MGNLRTRDLDCVIVGHHALDVCAREAVTYKVDHHLDREPVCHHRRFGAAVAGCGEQLRRAALARIGAALSLCRANFPFAGTFDTSSLAFLKIALSTRLLSLKASRSLDVTTAG